MTPEQISQAAALRMAGYPLSKISEIIAVPFGTVKNNLLKHGVKKSSIKKEVIERARRSLIDSVSATESVREALARQIVDDIASTNMLREKLLLAADKLNANNLNEAQSVARAGAAIATALKVCSDTVTKHFHPDVARRLEDKPQDDLMKGVVDSLMESLTSKSH